jgi:hypothetical protein
MRLLDGVTTLTYEIPRTSPTVGLLEVGEREEADGAVGRDVGVGPPQQEPGLQLELAHLSCLVLLARPR